MHHGSVDYFGSTLCSFCKSIAVHDDHYASSALKSVINSQRSCHVHFINKYRVRINGELKPPMTIDTRSKKSISLPLTRMKPLNCVILIGKFNRKQLEELSIYYLHRYLETFHYTFLSNMHHRRLNRLDSQYLYS